MATSIDGAAVAAWMGLDSTTASSEAAVLDEVAAAVSSFVTDQCPRAPRDEAGDWMATTTLGAKMLGARLYRRRNSPNGIEAFSDLGTSYVSRYDSDIARMLRIDAYRMPVAR